MVTCAIFLGTCGRQLGTSGIEILGGRGFYDGKRQIRRSSPSQAEKVSAKVRDVRPELEFGKCCVWSTYEASIRASFC